MRSDSCGGTLQNVPPAQAPILCVDGSRSSLDHLSAGLRKAGFATLTAADGGTAIAITICAQTRPAVAIINCVLPDGSGIEVARRLQEGGSLPVILLATDPDWTLINQAADAGAMSVLIKPVEMLQLLPAVRSALLRYRELEQLRQRVQRLESTGRKRHETGIVVGLLMERLQIPPHEAFARLRRYARKHNRKIGDVAAEILRGSENLLRITRQIGDAGGATTTKET